MKTLETKFIEDTNHQYSIQEDGALIRHFKQFRIKGGGYETIRETIVVPYTKAPNRNCLFFKTNCNGKTLRFSKNVLLAKYFGYMFCPQCTQKTETTKYIKICCTCAKKNANKNSQKWKKMNPEKYKECLSKSYHKNRSKNAPKRIAKLKEQRSIISRNYAASRLNISISDLTDEIYESFKKTLLLKREVSKEFNIPVKHVR